MDTFLGATISSDILMVKMLVLNDSGVLESCHTGSEGRSKSRETVHWSKENDSHEDN
jgi:hypothetical protein